MFPSIALGMEQPSSNTTQPTLIICYRRYRYPVTVLYRTWQHEVTCRPGGAQLPEPTGAGEEERAAAWGSSGTLRSQPVRDGGACATCPCGQI